MKDLIRKCESEGVTLTCGDGKNIRFRSSGPVSAELLAEIKAHKQELIAFLTEGAAPAPADPAGDADRYEPFPLTDIQNAYHSGRGGDYEYGGTGCYTYIEIKLPRLDPDRFREAWYRTIQKHDMLHAVITRESTQYVTREAEMPSLEVYDAGDFAGALEDSPAVKAKRAELEAFDFGSADRNLHKFVLGRGREESILHFCVDMLVADFISINIILTDILSWYNTGSFPAREGQVSFRDAVLRKRAAAAKEADRQYWTDRIAGGLYKTPTLPLPAEVSSAPASFFRKAMFLPEAEYKRFKENCARQGLTVSNAILSAYEWVLSRWTEDGSVCVNVTLMQRGEDEKAVVGDFTSVDLLAFRDDGSDFGAIARGTKDRLFEDLSHAGMSGVEVMRLIGRNTSGKVLFPVVYTSTLGADSAPDVLALTITGGISRTPQVWIDCQVLERGTGLEVHWDIRDHVFDAKITDDLFAAFAETVKRVASCENFAEITDIAFPAGYFDKRNEYNAVRADYPRRMLYVGFLEQVAARPEKTALIWNGREYSYAALAGMASVIRERLAQLGVSRGDKVAVALRRGPVQAASVLAVLLCGAAYVPVDINQPFTRQEIIIRSSDAAAVLAGENAARIKEAFADITLFPERFAVPETEGVPDLTPPADADSADLAYLIFTSGTTGIPKGVMISHAEAENTMADMNRRFNVGPEDVFLGLTKLSFDLSVYDLFGCFDAGAALVLPAEENARNPAEWIRLIGAHSVTVWNSVPAMLKMLLSDLSEEDKASVSSLKTLFLSGDVIDPDLPSRLREVLSDYRLISLGGATEGSVWSIWWDVTDHLPADGVLPYGVALTNQQMFVLDMNGRQSPDYVKGEIVIGGDGVADGYYKDEKLTAAKYAYSESLSTRLFRTGDVGYVRPDGVMMICGRKDFQIKINGNRVETGEIESVVRETGEVGDCRVVYHKADGKGKLFLFLSPRKEKAGDAAAPAVDLDGLMEACNRHFDDVDRELYARWRSESDKAALADMLAFFRRVGVFASGEKFTLAKIHEACAEQEEFHTIVERFLRALVQAGQVKEENGAYFADPSAEAYADRDGIWDGFMATGDALGYGRRLMEYQRKSGRCILEQVRGEIRGISLFFPQGGTDVAVAAYRENLINERLNHIVADIMDTLSDEKCRVLEIGAGVGGTTSDVLSRIASKVQRYCFTDVSAFFLNNAAQVYKDYACMDYKLLDINKDYAEQGFEKNGFDLILCANVLHNSVNIGENLSKIRNLLRPGGYLVIIEATQESYLLTTSLELKGGLTGYTDHRADGIDVFTSLAKWRELITGAGYEVCFDLPHREDVLCSSGQSVILSRKPGGSADAERLSFAGAGGINVEKIEKHMASRLPAYMIPEQIEIIDAIPLTANGKTDRKKLSEICEEKCARIRESARPVAGMTEMESRIAEVWKRVLNLPAVSPDDNFYYVGGDSLLITQVVSAMKKEIPALEQVSWDELMHNALNNPTIRGLATVLEQKHAVAAAPAVKKQEAGAASGKALSSDPCLRVFRDKPEKRTRILACFHAGTGRLADYEFLVPDILEKTGEDLSVLGFMYGNDEEYVSVPADELITARAEKYANILLQAGAKEYVLAGYCVGGYLALETARYMLERGANVANVVMIASEPATHVISNPMLMELSYGAAIGLDMRLTGFKIDIDSMRRAIEGILKGENRNVKNSELMRLSGEYEYYGRLFTDLGDMTQEERLKFIFDKAGNVRFNGNESSFAMFRLLYRIFDHTFRGMMAYEFKGKYLGDVTYLEAPTLNSFYPFTRQNRPLEDICAGGLKTKKIAGNHATCLLKENYGDVLDEMLKILRVD